MKQLKTDFFDYDYRAGLESYSFCPENEPRVNLNYSAQDFRRVSAHYGALFWCFGVRERWWRVSWGSG
jgi:hypothetical protein